MHYPSFYNQAPTITVHDPLAEALGALENGYIIYTYLDAVKLAGHSCPTVAGAFLMALKSLKTLYKDQIPERGEIEVTIHGKQDEGTNGVVANVMGLITGAAGVEGFKGLGGTYGRQGLLKFGTVNGTTVTMKNIVTGEAVSTHYDPAVLPLKTVPKELIQKVVNKDANKDDLNEFSMIWQGNVRMILENHGFPGLITMSPVTTGDKRTRLKTASLSL